jgi:hypothetical protein
MNIFDTALAVIILLFIIVIIYFVGVGIISVNIYPLMYSLKPSLTNKGISQATYISKLDRLSLTLTISFVIFMATVFLFVVVKLFYEKEEFSVYGYGG